MRYLISGGGTGGHIFPAISIANALKELDPEAEILFVKPWKNVSVLVDLAKSIRQVKKIIREFRPDVGVGVGGYASGAAMWAAAQMGIPILLQEQNGFAGVTNKILKDKASKICVAYEGMEKFFPADKIILTGNPVRQNLTEGRRNNAEGGPKNLLIIGGSLGARTINEAILAGLPQLLDAGIHVVWQTGKVYYENILQQVSALSLEGRGGERLFEIFDFLSDMPDRYAQADLVISRAGASSISELCLLGKPAILVPSPNVAEDHQTHNAMALVNKDAAVLVRDAEAADKLVSTALDLIRDDKRLETLHTNILKLAQADSAKRIAEEVIRLAKH